MRNVEESCRGFEYNHRQGKKRKNEECWGRLSRLELGLIDDDLAFCVDFTFCSDFAQKVKLKKLYLLGPFMLDSQNVDGAL